MTIIIISPRFLFYCRVSYVKAVRRGTERRTLKSGSGPEIRHRGNVKSPSVLNILITLPPFPPATITPQYGTIIDDMAYCYSGSGSGCGSGSSNSGSPNSRDASTNYLSHTFCL